MEVLVVAKSSAARDGLAAALRSSGCGVRVAGEAGEVVRWLREIAIDVVFVEALPSAEAERFRSQIRRLRAGCRLVFLGPADASPRPGADGSAKAWSLRPDDIATLLSGGGDAPAPDGDRKVKSLMQALSTVVSLLEAEDPYFAGGTHRVADLSDAIVRKMGLAPETSEEVAIASLLRDVGKVALGPYLFESSAAFGPEDAARMRDHVTWGERLLAHIDFPWRIREIVRHHHERYDGEGFPDRLAGRQIPIAARIVAAADAWVAMTSDRRHRPARSVEEARAEILSGIGGQFDPEVVEALLVAAREDPASTGDGDRPTVVVIDRDAAYRRLLRLRLLDAGLNVVLRDNLDDVPALAAARPPEAFVIDVAAEGVGGLETLSRVASLHGSGIPVIVVTHLADRATRQACASQRVEDLMSKSADLEEVVQRIRAVLERAGARSRRAPEQEDDGVSGRLEAMGLVDIVQFLSLGQKTAHVLLTEDDGSIGELWLDHGAIVHATCGSLEGEDAVYAMLAWTGGGFRIRHGVSPMVRTIVADSLFLLMEGLRRRDEATPHAT